MFCPGFLAAEEKIASRTGLPVGNSDGVIVVQEGQTASWQKPQTLSPRPLNLRYEAPNHDTRGPEPLSIGPLIGDSLQREPNALNHSPIKRMHKTKH